MADTSPIPLLYRLFFLYIEPISAVVGAYYAAARQSDYLAYLSSAPSGAAPGPSPLPTPTRTALFQLANLYLLFALNEHLVLASTPAHRTWARLLLGLLVADLGHLATMLPLAAEKGYAEVFLRFWRWDAMEWGSVGFVYAGASMRVAFLTGAPTTVRRLFVKDSRTKAE
ncbi:hypothetical protein WOLCODRAFT_131471 [Wolfiporia cocos MD-104 SS10]|uniref:DUF7704 domain-containing protein n=1 Tax=Wolfiporia cocos (strain MD-104) TaxID=742152 RepID=A0A2H3JFL4_WOLCO|nr:hypothetical protein WOLCODRAFT_131471 [Wolfiporia cocos MD-104 SS10]